VSRWTVTRGAVADDAHALIRLTVEEMATNELRETFHHWVRTIEFSIADGQLTERRPSSSFEHEGKAAPTADDVRTASQLWDEVARDIRLALRRRSEWLTKEVVSRLAALGQEARKQELERFQSRQGEISSLIQSNSIEHLKREIEREKVNKSRILRQPALLGDTEVELRRIDRSIEAMQEDVRRREQHAKELQELLRRERDRSIQRIIPKRYSLRGAVQVFPVAVEIVLPGQGR
jgi:hypothetical protein